MANLLIYRRLPSSLHAARASFGALWAASLALASVLLYHPLGLGAIGLAVLGAAYASGVGRAVAGSLRIALIVAAPIVIINVFASSGYGDTVFWRLGYVPPFGQVDLTLEALVYGAVIALKVTDLILVGALASLAIDPDELLAFCRRFSFRSALTASLALRMVPLLAADARRLAEAQRTRPGAAAEGRHRLRSRALLLAATVSGALDRSLDVAATLELRGLASGARVRSLRRPLSRHDLAFAGSALAVLALALAGRITGTVDFDAYPLVRLSSSPATWLICGALPLVALLPFLDRRGIVR
ncbi:MAG TPA: energy-coupling factor transporter transmembrane component T [Solirubrobacteraceae bacterium]|jgi:energy-coupling factor transport system permease protein